MKDFWLTRRDLIVRGLAAGAAVYGVSSLRAFGQTTTAAEPKRGGRLRVGVAGGGASDTVNARGVISSQMDNARLLNLYSQLWEIGPDGSLVSALAEEGTPNATADEWTVRLRKDLEFHNGKTVTADDLIYSVGAILSPKNAAPGASYLAHIDPNGMTKVDDRTVRFKLKYPFAPFKWNFTDFVYVVPRDYDSKNPVGTGPFKYKSFAPGEQSVFEANKNFWGEGPYVDELVLINIDDEAARVNALLSGEVEAIGDVPFSQMLVVEGSGTSKLLLSDTGALRIFTMRVDVEPFNDPRVRQAIRLVADRNQLVELAFSGQGRVGNDIPAPYDPAYNSDLPQRKQDIEAAKKLLAEAGKENLTVELVTAPIQAGLVEMALVLAEQAKQAGITVNVRQVDAGTFYGEQYLKWPFAVDWYPGLTYLKQVALSQVKNAPFNETHWNDPEYQALYEKALGTIDDNARHEILKQMQKIEYDRGGVLIFGFPNQIDAHASTVTGFAPHVVGVPLSNFGFNRASFL